MKGSSYVVNTHKFSYFPSLSNINHPLIPCQSVVFPKPLLGKLRDLSHAACVMQQRKGNDDFVVGCASWGLVTELEGELEDEEKGRSGMARFRHKCGERKGVVELLECLEREAMMGEDVGKEPNDYNRRAQIFDTSSRVFQALKEHNKEVTSI